MSYNTCALSSNTCVPFVYNWDTSNNCSNCIFMEARIVLLTMLSMTDEYNNWDLFYMIRVISNTSIIIDLGNLLNTLWELFTMLSSASIIVTLWQTYSSSASLIKFIIFKTHTQKQFIFMSFVGVIYSQGLMDIEPAVTTPLQETSLNKVRIW